MRVKVKLTKISGKLLPNNSDNYWANGLQYMYGGVNPVMLATEDGGDARFSISINFQTKNGNTWTSVIDENQGVVIADAESFAYNSTYREDGVPVEHIQATIPKSSQWYLIDAPEVGHASVFYAKGLTELKNVRQTGQGVTGMSIGLFMPTQSSTAPESYGTAMHLQEQMNFGNIQPLSGYNSIDSILSKSNGQLPEIKNQTVVSFDRDNVKVPKEYDISSTILNMDIDITAINLDTKDGYIYAWVDINGDGFFSENESMKVLIPKGTTSETYTISYPYSLLQNANLGDTWVRLRVTTDELINTSSDSSKIDSRSYDYASNGEVLDQQIIFSKSFNNNVILPVRLVSFEVKNIGKANQIIWETANETNNQYFEILKSENGVDGWHVVEKVKPTGNSNNIYQVIDRAIAGTIQYYRLKQVDNDGKEILFAIHSIRNELNNSLNQNYKVFPHPFVSQLNVEANIQEQGQYSVEIYSMSGTKVFQEFYRLQVGLQKINIAGLGNLPSGTYILRFNNNNETLTTKLIIKQ